MPIQHEKISFSLLDALKKNIRLSRRQACKLGAFVTLNISGLLTFHGKHALAMNSKGTYNKEEEIMKLMPPVLDGNLSLERAIEQRRTISSFKHAPLTI